MLKKFVFVLGCALVSIGAAHAGTLVVRDSVGTKAINGKIYITHKVEPSETLYALSRKYGVPVGQIVAANKNIEKAIHVGQIVLVPSKTGSTATATPVKTVATVAASKPVTPAAKPSTSAATAAVPAASRTYVVDAKGNRIHTVLPKQTLYAISRLHQVSLDNLKKWNKLTENTVEIGQELIVGTGDKPNLQAAAKKPIYVPEKDEEVTLPKQAGSTPTASVAVVTEKTEKPAAPAVSKSKTGVKPVTAKPAIPTTIAKPVPVKTETPKTETPATPASKPAAPASKGDTKDNETVTTEYSARVSESGMAEAIDQKVDANKFLALHKTAPVGTIMAVKNPMNSQTVYVRVIGKLPETGENDKVIIKLSKKACQQIGANDARFRVELSYMP